MDFADRIAELSTRAARQLEHTATEEATKNALVLPFIQALGYDPFNLQEVIPEFTADVGVKKGEKVDYVITQEGAPVIIVEVKSSSTDLDDAHYSQLFRYFHVTDTRFAVLTNGIIYRFFTDLDSQNRMDERWFLEFNLLDPKPAHVEELKKFTKEAFNLDNILETANELKYTNAIKQILEKQRTDPDEEFVRFFAKQVYSGHLTAQMREQFTTITRRAFRQFINDQISGKLYAALEDTGELPRIPAPPAPSEEDQEKIVTTEEEREAYLIVRGIMREVVDASRVIMRDAQSYCAILLDDNNRRPVCRLHFNTSQKYLGVFDVDKNEERIAIDGLDDIYQYADRLKATAEFYD